MSLNKALGQVMTPEETAKKMLSLRQCSGSVLDPTCGQGVFLNLVPEAVGWEIDPAIVSDDVKPRVSIGDFLTSSHSHSYSTVIGNPPYVNGREVDLSDSPTTALMSSTANLYFHVTWKAIDLIKPGGELIWIIPTGFFTNSLGKPLREKMLREGAFTDVLWDAEAEWDNALIEAHVFRWQKGLTQGPCRWNSGERWLHSHNGTIIFAPFEPTGVIGDWFKASVGFAPKKSLLREAGESGSQSFYKMRGEWKTYDVSDPSDWPRWRNIAAAERILYDPGLSRKMPRFEVSTEKYITCNYLEPVIPMDLSSARQALEDWGFWKDLGFVSSDGRWSAGVKRLMCCPVDAQLGHLLDKAKKEVNDH